MKKLLLSLSPLVLFLYVIVEAFSYPLIKPAAAQGTGTYTCVAGSNPGTCRIGNDSCVSPAVPDLCYFNSSSRVCNPINATACVAPPPPPPPSTTGKYYCADTTTSCSSFSFPPDPCKSSYVPGPCSGTWPNCSPQYSSPAQCVAPAAAGNCHSTFTAGSCQIADNCDAANGYYCNLVGRPPATACPGNAGTTGNCMRVGGLVVTPVPCLPTFGANGIQTALGCVPTKLEGVIPWLLRAVAGVSGGIALLLLFYGGLTYIMAGGEKTGVEEAKGIITAAISGLLLVIFSVLILRIIGINILGIPAITVGPNNEIVVPGT